MMWGRNRRNDLRELVRLAKRPCSVQFLPSILVSQLLVMILPSRRLLALRRHSISRCVRRSDEWDVRNCQSFSFRSFLTRRYNVLSNSLSRLLVSRVRSATVLLSTNSSSLPSSLINSKANSSDSVPISCSTFPSNSRKAFSEAEPFLKNQPVLISSGFDKAR